jgi:hypothetical protein
MISSGKKPGVAFWATVVVVVVLIAYPLSIGPACWISSRANLGTYEVMDVYSPLLTLAMSTDSKTVVNRVIWWYTEVGAAEDWEWDPIWEDDASGISRPVGWWWGAPP